ncbi:MAG: tetratricopeptide repeat protein [Microcoleus sp.]
MSQSPATQKLDTSPEGVYRALLRCLKRTKGFGIVFVQSSPAVGSRLITRVRADLSEKKIAILELTEPIDNLYDIVANRDDRNDLNILFIQGLEKSLEPYIKPGYGGDGDYYNLDTVPPLLSHLNQRREIFRDRLSNICFVFILPLFAIKYIIRRAPDFFDWGSGVFELSFELSYNQIAQTHPKITERLQQIINKPFPSINDEYEPWIKLLIAMGNLSFTCDIYEEAIKQYELAIKRKPDLYEAWNLRGIALLQLGRYEESIASFDKALEINPDYHEAKTNRDLVLNELN